MRIRTQYGFSLVELMVAIALSSVVIVAMYGTVIQQQRTATQQEHTVEVRQTARLAMDAMLSELRSAGFDPDGTARAGIVSADATHIHFTRDLNCSGTLAALNPALPPPQGDSSDEDLAYSFDAAHQMLRRTVHNRGAPVGGAQPVASNILGVDFCYFVGANTATCVSNPAPLSDIRAVRVTLTARATGADPNYTDAAPNVPANLRHYRKASLTTVVHLRSLNVNRGNPKSPRTPFNQPCPLP